MVGLAALVRGDGVDMTAKSHFLTNGLVRYKKYLTGLIVNHFSLLNPKLHVCHRCPK